MKPSICYLEAFESCFYAIWRERQVQRKCKHRCSRCPSPGHQQLLSGPIGSVVKSWGPWEMRTHRISRIRCPWGKAWKKQSFAYACKGICVQADIYFFLLCICPSERFLAQNPVHFSSIGPIITSFLSKTCAVLGSLRPKLAITASLLRFCAAKKILLSSKNKPKISK